MLLRRRNEKGGLIIGNAPLASAEGAFSGTMVQVAWRQRRRTLTHQIAPKLTQSKPHDNVRDYSHSIVAGGLLVMSYTTRFTPGTSATIRELTRPSSS